MKKREPYKIVRFFSSGIWYNTGDRRRKNEKNCNH